MTTTPQAALLSDKEINARIRSSEVHEYHPGAILELVRELEQDILSKLKPQPSMLTNNELIDLAIEHGLGRRMPPLGLNTGNVFYTDNSYRTAALFDFADAHEAAILAKLQATQEPAQAGSASLLDGCKSIMDSIAVSSSVVEHNRREPVQAGELLDEHIPSIGCGFWIDKISVSNLRHIHRSESATAMISALINATDAIEDAQALIATLRAALAARKPLTLTDEQRLMFKNIEGMLDAYVASIRQYGDYEVWHYIPEVEAHRDDLASYVSEVNGIGLEVKP